VPDPPIKDEDRDDAPPEESAPPEPPRGEPSRDDEDDDADEDPDEDAASPEAIARRVAALGDDDETDRIALAEELKLDERRRKQKKKRKGGLEAAATKKLAKIGAKAAATSPGRHGGRSGPARRASGQVRRLGQEEPRPPSRSWHRRCRPLGRGRERLRVRREATRGAGLGRSLPRRWMTSTAGSAIPTRTTTTSHPHDPRPIFKTTEDRRARRRCGSTATSPRSSKGRGQGILARLAEGAILPRQARHRRVR
jgi:hypothetical protein